MAQSQSTHVSARPYPSRVDENTLLSGRVGRLGALLRSSFADAPSEAEASRRTPFIHCMIGVMVVRSSQLALLPPANDCLRRSSCLVMAMLISMYMVGSYRTTALALSPGLPLYCSEVNETQRTSLRACYCSERALKRAKANRIIW